MLQRLMHFGRLSRHRSLGFLIAALCSLGNVDPAVAASSEATAAQALFDEAKALMARGDYGPACSKLEESQRLDPALGTLLNLADCREKQGKFATAWSLFRDAEGLLHRSGPADAEAVAHERAAALEGRVPRLRIALAPGQPSDLKLTRNGTLVGAAQLDTPIPLDPGAYEVVASAPGYRAWQTTVSLQERAGTVSLTVPPLVAEASPPIAVGPASKELAAPDNAPPGRVPTASWVLGGIGIAAVGTSLGLGLWAKSQYQGADCPAHVCASNAELGQRDAARTKATAATAVFIGGALALGGGIVLWAVQPKTPEKRAVSVSLGAGAPALVVAGEL